MEGQLHAQLFGAELAAAAAAPAAPPKRKRKREGAVVSSSPSPPTVARPDAPAKLPPTVRQLVANGVPVQSMSTVVRACFAPVYRIDTVRVLSDSEATHLLRHEANVLPLYGARHETTLMRQAGTFTVHSGRKITFPPCLFGEACVTNTLGGGGIPPICSSLSVAFVSMRAMTPMQWSALVMHGEQPLGEAPCVLCHRRIISSDVQHRRYLQSTGQLLLQLNEQRPVVQLWRNPIDCPDGYFGPYVLHAQPNEDIVAPLVLPNHYNTRAYRAGVDGQWRICQAALIWRPNARAEPKIGEMQARFC